MDILYYSNYCKHSQKLVNYLAKNRLSDKLNFICIDRRMRDPQTQAIVAILENGNRIVIPPNVQSVPTLLLVKQKYSALIGDAIYEYLKPMAQSQVSSAVLNNGEPVGVGLGGNSVGNAQASFDNFMSAGHETQHIYLPPEDYNSGKIKEEDGNTLDNLKQMREQDLQNMMPPLDSGNAIGNVSVQGGGYGMLPPTQPQQYQGGGRPQYQLHV